QFHVERRVLRPGEVQPEVFFTAVGKPAATRIHLQQPGDRAVDHGVHDAADAAAGAGDDTLPFSRQNLAERIAAGADDHAAVRGGYRPQSTAGAVRLAEPFSDESRRAPAEPADRLAGAGGVLGHRDSAGDE